MSTDAARLTLCPLERLVNMKSVLVVVCVATACTPTAEPQRPDASSTSVAAATVAPAAPRSPDAGWQTSAAAYLDMRSNKWLASPPRAGQRSDCALCCHTTHPYLFSRPLLGTSQTDVTGELRSAIEARVAFEGDWQKQTPWYGQDGSDKAAESLGNEAVLNAVTLTLHDQALNRAPTPSTIRAVERMWEIQRDDGGFDWLDFKLEPWEAGNETWGAAMAALAAGRVGTTHAGVDKLRAFLRERQNPTLHDQLTILWASTALDGLVTADVHHATLAAVVDKQRSDGGWSAEALMGVRTGDTAANAYATAYTTFVLCTVRNDAPDQSLTNGLRWLRQHQHEDGSWPTPSSNRDSERGGRFMTDAATGYATLALTRCTQ